MLTVNTLRHTENQFHVLIQRGVGAGGPNPPEKLKKYSVSFLALTGPDPLKFSKLRQASIQCWVIIGTPAKLHSKMAFHWRADNGPLLVVFESSPP